MEFISVKTQLVNKLEHCLPQRVPVWRAGNVARVGNMKNNKGNVVAVQAVGM